MAFAIAIVLIIFKVFLACFAHQRPALQTFQQLNMCGFPHLLKCDTVFISALRTIAIASLNQHLMLHARTLITCLTMKNIIVLGVVADNCVSLAIWTFKFTNVSSIFIRCFFPFEEILNLSKGNLFFAFPNRTIDITSVLV